MADTHWATGAASIRRTAGVRPVPTTTVWYPPIRISAGKKGVVDPPAPKHGALMVFFNTLPVFAF